MVKDKLKESETIAYTSLKNDLNNNRLAHSYLLYGEVNPLKKETAFLLAQSIIENKNDFACEVCDRCKRIKEGKYFDVIYVDGNAETIKKEHIERIMDEFNKTSLEKSNKKVYILDNINNSSPKVLNMILKFMEEPSSSDTYGIFISDNIDGLLETIVSRCQKIPFMTRDFSYVYKLYEKKGFDYLDSYLLGNINHEVIDIELNDEVYLNAKEYVYKTIDNLEKKEEIPIIFFKDLYSCLPKDKLKKCLDEYVEIMLVMIDDAINNSIINDSEYMNYINKLKADDLAKLLDIFLSAKDKIDKGISRTLLFDQIVQQIIS